MTHIKNIVKVMISIVAWTFLFALFIVSIPFAIVDLLIVFGTMVVFDRIEERGNRKCTL